MNIFRKLVKEDCELLINRFQKTNSVRFEVFCRIWKEMKFEQIFYGTVRHEKREFSRLILDTAYTFLHPPFSFQVRVGGLFLLYALFKRQTASPPQQIRVALKDWDDVMKFEKDALEAQHFDIVYILRQLMHHKAFVFTAMPQLLMFEKKKKMMVKDSQLCEGFMERPSAPQQLINVALLEELSHVHDLYESLKSSVCPISDSSGSLLHQDLVPELRNSVLDFYKWQQDKDTSSREEDGGEGTSTQQESSRRADLLASIKSRAYGEAAEVSKSRRHRAVDVTSSESSSASATRYVKMKQRTLKYRATNSLQVSDDLLREATSLTHISHLTTVTSAAQENPKPSRCYKKFKWKKS